MKTIAPINNPMHLRCPFMGGGECMGTDCACSAANNATDYISCGLSSAKHPAVVGTHEVYGGDHFGRLHTALDRGVTLYG